MSELHELVHTTQEANSASMLQIQSIIESSNISLNNYSLIQNTNKLMKKQLLNLLQSHQLQLTGKLCDIY